MVWMGGYILGKLSPLFQLQTLKNAFAFDCCLCVIWYLFCQYKDKWKRHSREICKNAVGLPGSSQIEKHWICKTADLFTSVAFKLLQIYFSPLSGDSSGGNVSIFQQTFFYILTLKIRKQNKMDSHHMMVSQKS